MKRMYLLSVFTAVILFCPATLAHASERAWDVSPFVSGGRVFVPLRMAAETLSCQTVWDDAAKAATV
ncbi:MAG: copper amine oxidase N-terminal domain-containing protein, partial [Peptococcaceae bacterium]|nr:copper amine oxidase N-terminal domain-containing protein [Peptococcaceae bacterium]